MNKKISIEECVKTIYKALDDKKAEDIQILDIREVSCMADYFVIANGTSSTHIKALSDEVEEKLSEAGVNPIGREGMSTAYWILMDYSDVIVHIFSNESREFYSIENLWADAKDVDISSIITED